MARRAKAKHYRKQAKRKARTTPSVPLHDDIRQRAAQVTHIPQATTRNRED